MGQNFRAKPSVQLFKENILDMKRDTSKSFELSTHHC